VLAFVGLRSGYPAQFAQWVEIKRDDFTLWEMSLYCVDRQTVGAFVSELRGDNSTLTDLMIDIFGDKIVALDPWDVRLWKNFHIQYVFPHKINCRARCGKKRFILFGHSGRLASVRIGPVKRTKLSIW